jgi:hypothetical protein
MLKERGRIRLAVLVTACVLVSSSAALGTAMFTTANIIEVSATTSDGTATFSEVFPVSSFDGQLGWTLDAPLSLSAQGQEIATIDDLSLTYDADPQVDLRFALRNTSMTDDCFFSITAATIQFTPVQDAQAAASASVTLSQGAGSPSGGALTGLFDGFLYEARYSTSDTVNEQIVFAQLVPSISFSSGLGLSSTQQLPASGMSSLGTTVHMMESEFQFTLSPGDQASGTSAFLVTPEPASGLLVLLAGVLGLRRRR